MTKTNGGHGPAVIFGYKYAITNHADYIFQTDSDGQTEPYEFDSFWKLRNEYDAVIGNRRVRKDGLDRKFVEYVLCLILKMFFGVRIQDSNAPFRLMKQELLARHMIRIPEDFNLPNVMLTTFFVYFHEKIKFMEITFKPRQGGINSINIRKITKIGWKALGDFRIYRKQLSGRSKI